MLCIQLETNNISLVDKVASLYAELDLYDGVFLRKSVVRM